jgi:hypothetical protein
MCRSIKTLFNFEPPATDEEIRAASLVTTAPARDRAVEAAKARARGVERFGRSSRSAGG